MPIYKLTTLLLKASPFHDRFPIPWEDADREALELMVERQRRDRQVLEGEAGAG
ncbi:MAG: hypothetical protein ACTSU5_02640 [Promethearchaeota archaeon]